MLNELGDMNTIHFVDPYPDVPLLNRPFAKNVKRCDEVILKLEFIEKEMIKFRKNV